LKAKEYYDEFLRAENEGKCKVCGKETTFFHGKYKDHCSKKCAISNRENPFSNDDVKKKIKEINIERFGVENPSQSNLIKEKKKVTCLNNFGVEFPSHSKEINEKKRLTNLKKYGFENAMHNPEIAKKAALNGGGRARSESYITKFGDKIQVQGSFEKQFVEMCEDNNIRVLNGPFMYYEECGERHKYFVDFQIEMDNTTRLIEIKSTY